MDPVLHGILLAAALVMVTFVGIFFLQEEGKRRYLGYALIGYVFSILLLVVFAVMEG